MRSQDKHTIFHFLRQQHVLTLAVAYQGELWCANCFYVFNEQQMTLYLMTDSESRHGQLMQKNPAISGTVAYQTENIAHIQGVQYQGDIYRLAGQEEKKAKIQYYQRFPLAQHLSAPIWGIRLHLLKMTNNQAGFARKVFWQRENIVDGDSDQ